MDQEAKYWKQKWEEAQKQMHMFKQILKDQFELSDDRVTELMSEEKKHGKQRTAKK